MFLCTPSSSGVFTMKEGYLKYLYLRWLCMIWKKGQEANPLNVSR